MFFEHEHLSAEGAQYSRCFFQQITFRSKNSGDLKRLHPSHTLLSLSSSKIFHKWKVVTI